VYDQLNDLLSLGLHRVWKRAAVRWTGAAAGGRAIDVCCGSGDIALRLADAVGPSGEVVGRDTLTLFPHFSAQPEIPVLWSFVNETPPNSSHKKWLS